jgi:hypothetical protein
MLRKISFDHELLDQVLVLVGAGDVAEVGIPCSQGLAHDHGTLFTSVASADSGSARTRWWRNDYLNVSR